MKQSFVERKGVNLVLAEGVLSVTGNIILFGLKLWVGLITGSVALTADAWHTLTDSISSAIVIFSSWASNRPADEKHPFGHGRTDLICSVIIGVLLVMIGVEFIFKSLDQFTKGDRVVFGWAAISVTVLSITVKEGMAQFAFWAGKKTGSPTLRADGWHHRTDALSSIIILIGIFCSDLFWWIDGAMGILVALFIFYAAFEILRDAINRLIGEPPDPEILHDVTKIVKELSPDLDPHHFHLHRYGEHIELTFHIGMAKEFTLEKAHDITHEIEQTLREQMKIEATIHMEPKIERNHD